MENEKKTQGNAGIPMINFLFNIVIPAAIIYTPIPEFLKSIESVELLSLYKFLFALAFPAGYFVYDLISRKKTNFISVFGFVTIFLIWIIKYGGLSKEWVIFIKTVIPLVIALVFLISLKMRVPLVRKMFYNEKILDVERIDQIVAGKQEKSRLSRIFTNSTYMLAASFIFSSVLNFVLARIIIQNNPTDNPELFDQEVAKMWVVTKLVIAIPSTIIMILILWYVFHSMKKLTGLTMEELFAEHLREKTKEK